MKLTGLPAIAFLFFLSFFFGEKSFAYFDTSGYSTKQEAINFISGVVLNTSAHWPNVQPEAFLENIKTNIEQPLSIYEGRGTNFCAYAALSYIPLNDDPLRFTKFMIALYENGTAKIGRVTFNPSAEIQKAAGTLRFKGKLDIRPADQMWMLVLADHFKGYLNLFNHHYDPGDEDGFWASTNYAKFNRMIRRLFNYKVEATGSDLIRPGKKDLVNYLLKRMDSGITFLYLNNTFLTKKKHGPKRRLPTHFLVLLSIVQVNDLLTIKYWDYGGITLQQVTPSFLRKITFGISHCTPKNAHAD